MSQILRRNVLRGLLAAPAAGLALRSAATGLPIAFLLNPLREASADDSLAVDPARAQFAVMSFSDSGEPLNNNCPGGYEYPEMVHGTDPILAKTAMQLGGKAVHSAQIWSTLPQWVLDRSMFLQHATFANNHGNIQNVMRLMGRARALDMIPSIYARYLAPALKTVQSTPLSATGSAQEIIIANGVRIPNTPPMAWKEIIGQYEAVPSAMQKLRDESMKEIYATLKAQGTRAQIRYLDRLAISGEEAKKLGGDVASIFDGIKDDSNDAQLHAAIAIFKMNLSPVVGVSLNFGRDNHKDPDLANETKGLKDGIPALGKFFATLKANKMEDKVTFVSFGVFGRNFNVDPKRGRDHWGNHHTTIVIGNNVKAGLYGGSRPGGGDFFATGIDSASGAGVADGGDIPVGESLGAAGKTIGAALGLSVATMNQEVSGGKVVTAAIRS